MTIRAATAQWFELLTSREELGAALDCLSRTGSVQLQAYSQSDSRLALPDLRQALAQHETLARRYSHWWPAAHMQPPDREYQLTEAPREAIERLRAWAAEADPVVAELEAIALARAETESLALLQALGGATLPRLDRVAAAGPLLASRVYAMPAGGPPLALPPAVLMQRVAANNEVFVIAVGPKEDMADVDQAFAARKARSIGLPTDLPADSAAIQQSIKERRAVLDEREQAARASLARCNEHHKVAEALGELTLAAWVVAHVPELPVTEHFAWVTGWCSDDDEQRLRAALDRRELHYLLRFTSAPEGEVPPSVLRNPRWARPFEVFTGLMGVPGAGEADPSMVVAFLAPLMFGFMFGDVVQGLVVAVAGWLLRDRLPAMRLLLPGGVVAICFGFAFGSAFAREDLVPALWVHPLESPLTVLGTALAFGFGVIVLGQLLNGLQHSWRGAFRHWLACDAGVLVAYLGVVGAALDMRALWLLPIGIAWALAGAAAVATRDRAGALGAAAGEVVEHMLQLTVNTVSFVRVGAFALAHAGLSTAVVGMAEAAGPGYWPVLIIGNVFIIALEGLVVGIQTTRLILFEFFIRFLTAGGRLFEPLMPPTAQSQTTPPESKP
jgi:V/A-type H+-transporting ATPase subunit I